MLLIFNSLQAQVPRTFIRHYTTEDGLPSNNCYFTFQDSKGLIWIGTDAGVSCFNGQWFENYSIDDGLPDNQILKIKEDNKGRIWFVAFNGEMSYYLDGLIYNSKNDPSLGLLKFNAVVISIFQDSQDRMWFGTNKNLLYMFDGKTLTKFSSKDANHQFIFTYMNEDEQGTIWAYSDKSVRIFTNHAFRLLKNKPFKLISFRTFMNLKQNRFMYIDKEGLNYRKGNTKLSFKNIDPALLFNNLSYFYADQNEVWLSHKNGIYHQNKDGRVKTYLEGVPTVQIIKDDQQNMWFTTTGGIYMLPKKQKRIYTVSKKQGLSREIVKSIVKDNNQQLWLGMDNNYLNKLQLETKKIDHIKIADEGVFGGGIKKLVIDTVQQSLYFSSDYGLGKLHHLNEKAYRFTYLKEKHRTRYVLKDFSLNKTTGLSIALSSGVVLVPDRKKQLEINMLNLKQGISFFPNRAYSVFFDKDNSLWFSNTAGLNQVNNGIITSYAQNLIITKRINDIDQLQDGTMVLATDGYGLLLIKGNKIIHHFTQEKGLASNICKKIFIKNNHIWIITNNGINNICMDVKKPRINFYEYTNALLKNDVNDIFVDDKTAYFATNTGLVYFDFLNDKKTVTPPRALISAIEINNQKQSLKDPELILSSDDNKIIFHFGAIDFDGQSIWYRYRMRSTDTWSETRNKRVQFSNLEPGKYKFEVASRTGNSQWSETATKKFQLKAHFWQTSWFVLILFIFAGLGFYGIALAVTRNQKDKEKQKLLLRNQILMLEQRALQAMMNPHFVFNVMNSIQHYINTKDTSSANKVLTGFARLIRKNMEICTKSYISLAEELTYLELYLSLEKKRFGDKLRYQIEVDSQLDQEETFIPSMLLQPYIENAIWHGIMPLEDGGDLKIAILLKNEHTLNIEIYDNGVGINNSIKDKTQSHESKGMSLTRERIDLLNQIAANPIHISVQQNGLSGTLVRIQMDIR